MIPPPARTPLPAFAFVWFSYFAALGVFNPYAPLWFKELGMSTLAIGAMASLQSWTRIVAPYGWGWLGDRQGQRVRILRWASLAAFVAALSLLAVRGHAVVAICVALLFVANGGVVPLSEAALAQHLVRGGVMDHAQYGRVRVWGSLGFIVAVLLMGWWLEAFGMPLFPIVVAIAFGVLALASWRLPQETPAAAVDQTPAPPVLEVLRRPAVRWFFLTVFLTVLAHTSLYAFLSLYLDALGYGKGAVGALWAVAVAVEIAAFWTQGRWFGRVSPHRWLELAAALSVLRFVALAALGQAVLVLVLAQMLHVVTFAAQHAACIALVNRHFPGALRGRGQALYTTLGYGLSGVLGGVGGGWLSSRLGFEAVFWAASGSALLAWLAARRAARVDGEDGAVA